MVAWIMENYQELGALLLALVGVAEVVVRLTPTKKDDGAMERIGHVIRKAMDLMKVPNVRKKPAEKDS
jgi:hypothetical protein